MITDEYLEKHYKVKCPDCGHISGIGYEGIHKDDTLFLKYRYNDPNFSSIIRCPNCKCVKENRHFIIYNECSEIDYNFSYKNIEDLIKNIKSSINLKNKAVIIESTKVDEIINKYDIGYFLLKESFHSINIRNIKKIAFNKGFKEFIEKYPNIRKILTTENIW